MKKIGIGGKDYEVTKVQNAAESKGGLTLIYAIIWIALILGTIFIGVLNFAISQIIFFMVY